MIMDRKATLLQKVRSNALFEGVDEATVNKAVERSQVIDYHAGDLVFGNRSHGHAMYLVLGGAIKLIDASKGGKEIILGVMHDGDFFGEMELIDGFSRSAEAGAATEATLLEMPEQTFRDLLTTSPRFTDNLLRNLSLRLRASNQTLMRQGEYYVEAFQRQLEKLHRLIEASKIVNSSIDLDTLLRLILETSTRTVGADRGTVYLIDSTKNELWSKVLQGSAMVEIRLPLGKGIAGYVAASGETVNLENAYGDPRFNPEVDKISGYHTMTMLCMPMKNREGTIIGVFQLLNKNDGLFTQEDEEFIEALSVHAAIAVENAQIAQAMVQSERLSSVGRLASTIIHDIKNPMGTLRVYAQVMKKKTENEETLHLADEMIHQIDRFVNMTQEILDFSRGVSSMNIEEVDVEAFMHSVLTVMKYDMQKRNIALEKQISFSGKVKLDPDKFMRVLLNVAGNAADAMPDGGTLKLAVSKQGSALVCEMTDTGVGIPPEIISKVFEPFVTHGKKHGTGLGMAIVKKIVDDHNGKIEIDSKLGSGTTVRIRIPIA
jgi:K+-sensing histidine kinase KdpD